jgi:hypothetical protein
VFGIGEREPRLRCHTTAAQKNGRSASDAGAPIVVIMEATSLPNCLTCLTSPRRASGSRSRPPAGGAGRAEREP